MQDGTIRLDEETLTSVIQAGVEAIMEDIDIEGGFLGVATPGLAPGKINAPTLYVAVAGGRYPSFSNNQVNEGEIHFFTSEDGLEWSDLVVYSEGGGETCTETEMPDDGFKPDTLYELGTIDEDTTFLMDTDAETDCGPNHYYWVFDTEGADPAPAITWPDAITAWKDGAAPEIAADARYEISVLDGCAIVSKFDIATA